VVRRQAVDVSPFRRVNFALYLMVRAITLELSLRLTTIFSPHASTYFSLHDQSTGARESSFRNIKTISECLADEIINAARGSSNSYAIKKKDEIERVAKANR
jgi:small subunit ribosomal protein S5e